MAAKTKPKTKAKPVKAKAKKHVVTAKKPVVTAKLKAKPVKPTKTTKTTKTTKKLDLSSDTLPERKPTDRKYKGYKFDTTDNNVVNYCRAVGMKPQNFCFLVNRLSCGKTIAETLASYKKFVPKSQLMVETVRRFAIRFDKIIRRQTKLRNNYLEKTRQKAKNLKLKETRQRGTAKNHVPDWKAILCEKIGPDGLPIKSEHHSHIRPNYEQLDLPIEELFKRISTYTKPELRHIIRYRTLDKQSLSMQTLSLVQMYLDTLHSNPKVRALALKYIIDRRYGSVINRVGNADGSKLDPFNQLLEVEKAKLKPAGA
jgi:hypothetical protein